jgi:hypothetical protein
VIKLGGGQGFYGDGHGPVADVLDAGVDYLVCEALAELTLAILQKDRMRDESLGYTRDLPLYVQAALPFVLEGRTRFITNAGGINPVAAGRAVHAMAKAAGVAGLKIATVVGDDVRGRADELGRPPPHVVTDDGRDLQARHPRRLGHGVHGPARGDGVDATCVGDEAGAAVEQERHGRLHVEREVARVAERLVAHAVLLQDGQRQLGQRLTDQIVDAGVEQVGHRRVPVAVEPLPASELDHC